MTDKFLYRYREQRYAGSVDECGNCIPRSGNMRVHLEKYSIVKETKCGVWIDVSYSLYGVGDIVPLSNCKFVNLKCRKKYGCLTIEEAKESFIARKNRQIRILSYQLEDAQEALRIIKDETTQF